MKIVTNEVYQTRYRPRIYGPDGQPVVPEEWDLEPDPGDSPLTAEEIAKKQSGLIKVSPSQFVEFAIKVPSKKEQKLVPFSFEQRRYLRRPYDSAANRTLLKTARQVEKSTLLGNKCLSMCCLDTSFNVLYVSPTKVQTNTFSQDRLKEPIENSEILKAWTTTKLSDNVFHKKFVNNSQITLRYAYHNADRVRGIPADLILIDELQDVLTDNIPVIEQCASHSEFKLYIYAGTPKSLDNCIERYWTDFSTQNEWVVPCDHHGLPNDPSTWHWNVLGISNIGKSHLICDRCGAQIFPMHPNAQWAAMNPKVWERLPEPFDGYRIPQLMVPWKEWHEIIHSLETASLAVFHNETLGLSYDSGTRPLRKQDLIDNCTPGLLFTAEKFNELKLKFGKHTPIFAGIDWGGGSSTHSYTVIALGAYLDGFFTTFYLRRFEGQETEPAVQLDLIKQLIGVWGVRLVGADYGGGFDRNSDLIRTFGSQKIWKYQYSNPKIKVRWNKDLGHYLVHRTEVMTDVFEAIKRKNVFRFPDWAHFERPYGQDCLNIFSEYNERSRQIEYKKSLDATDDSFHAILLCFLVSMILHPRIDVLRPDAKTAYSDEA
jgi:hypothetical protein